MNTRSLTRQDCHDILITAIEGGIGYWSKVEPLERDGDLNYVKTRVFIPRDEHDEDAGPPIEEGHDFTLTEPFSGDSEWVSIGVIDTGTIRKGFQVMFDHPEWGCTVRVKAAEDTGGIDATDADCIVQAGLLGDVVYG